MRSTRWLSLFLVAVVGASCVGPARTNDDYRLKARNSAKATSSAVATASLAARLVGGRKAPWPYIAVVLDSAERDADSVDSTFSSVQPPDRRSDQLRQRLGAVLNRAVETISAMRIAARRQASADLLDAAKDLGSVTRALRPFQDLSA